MHSFTFIKNLSFLLPTQLMQQMGGLGGGGEGKPNLDVSTRTLLFCEEKELVMPSWLCQVSSLDF